MAGARRRSPVGPRGNDRGPLRQPAVGGRATGRSARPQPRPVRRAAASRDASRDGARAGLSGRRAHHSRPLAAGSILGGWRSGVRLRLRDGLHVLLARPATTVSAGSGPHVHVVRGHAGRRDLGQEVLAGGVFGGMVPRCPLDRCRVEGDCSGLQPAPAWRARLVPGAAVHAPVHGGPRRHLHRGSGPGIPAPSRVRCSACSARTPHTGAVPHPGSLRPRHRPQARGPYLRWAGASPSAARCAVHSTASSSGRSAWAAASSP